jgi:hypothetical protein
LKKINKGFHKRRNEPRVLVVVLPW